MSRPLTGAARTAQTRRVLLDEARAVIATRTPSSVATTEALLVRAWEYTTPGQRARLEQEYRARVELEEFAEAIMPALRAAFTEHDAVVVKHGHAVPFNRPDVPLLPLTGPQSPGVAWGGVPNG